MHSIPHLIKENQGEPLISNGEPAQLPPGEAGVEPCLYHQSLLLNPRVDMANQRNCYAYKDTLKTVVSKINLNCCHLMRKKGNRL